MTPPDALRSGTDRCPGSRGRGPETLFERWAAVADRPRSPGGGGACPECECILWESLWADATTACNSPGRTPCAYVWPGLADKSAAIVEDVRPRVAVGVGSTARRARARPKDRVVIGRSHEAPGLAAGHSLSTGTPTGMLRRPDVTGLRAFAEGRSRRAERSPSPHHLFADARPSRLRSTPSPSALQADRSRRCAENTAQPCRVILSSPEQRPGPAGWQRPADRRTPVQSRLKTRGSPRMLDALSAWRSKGTAHTQVHRRGPAAGNVWMRVRPQPPLLQALREAANPDSILAGLLPGGICRTACCIRSDGSHWHRDA